ncbi:MAG: hypothetical protein CMH48_15205 [Muricauda sp.]|nr:hypothetical protein [Allomuricauda sp.]MAU17062.1 hypothetical protein [Allomuricauda sp.]MBC32174.1 hypothetical protein [Allomuricauda sp.]|tara:strand:+ start:1211 stop:2722 length:1512 start_codon:yes stop_codon:yes gene_type:complete
MKSRQKKNLNEIQALDLDQSLDAIKIYFLNDNPTLPKLKDFIAEKIADLTPYQYYHLIAWLLDNINDEMLLYNLDVIFDYSELDSKNYPDQDEWSVPASNEPIDHTILPDRFNDDCRSFFRKHHDGTIKFVLDDLSSMNVIDRVIKLYTGRDSISEPRIDLKRLFDLFSKDDRLNFTIPTFPKLERVPFYGLALDSFSGYEYEPHHLYKEMTHEIRREARNIKNLFAKKGSKELGHLFMDNSIILLPILFDFEVWKRLVLDLLQNKSIFHIAKTKIHLYINELTKLLREEFFSNITVERRSYLVRREESEIPFLKTYSPPKIHYSEYLSWLEKLDKTNIVKPALEKSLEKEPNNQIIISRQGSQRKLLDAMTDFFEHLKLKIDNDQERALESFIYRNFAFEPDDDTDFTKRTVSNYGFKPIDFIPPKHAKDFTKLLLYLSDKEYLLSNKTNIIKTLDEEIHGSGSKRDGFSYSSLIRIPNKEHHLFPDNEIRRRVRSILRIDD